MTNRRRVSLESFAMLRAEGYSLTECADLLGFSRSHVSRVYRDNKIEIDRLTGVERAEILKSLTEDQ